jgi:lycopene cyclase domain-containing protein
MNLPKQPEFDKNKGIPGYERGSRWPAWFGLAIPFLALMAVLFRYVKNLSLKSALAVIVVFEIGTLCIEHHAVVNGHWVYNRAKLLGPLIWDVPIEEVLIYYLFPPLFVIFIMLLFNQYFLRQQTKKIINSEKPCDKNG